MWRRAVIALGLALALAFLAAWTLFRRDLAHAVQAAASGAQVLATACGPIETAALGSGRPLLVVHGSGGGHDPAIAFAAPQREQGFRLVAPSRFGYLRTPRPDDASPAAQADAYACRFDALGIGQADVLGVSAGAAPALELAIRHPDRVASLALVVPIAWHPGLARESGRPRSAAADRWLMRLLGSDVALWLALRLAPSRVVQFVLATPPALLAAAAPEEKARVARMAWSIPPVSARAAGLRDETRLGRQLRAADLAGVRAPTVVVSARDDGFGTFDGAAFTAAGIAGANFVGYEAGGHLLVGRYAQALEAVAANARSAQAIDGARRGE